MIKSTLRELMQGKLDDVDLAGVYMVRDGEHVLYIGRSTDVVSRLKYHVEHYTSSEIGDLVQFNRPQSWNWQIELRAPEECREIVEMYSPVYRNNKEHAISIEAAELDMIMHYHPCANTSNNPNRSRRPKHIKSIHDMPIEVGITDDLF